jgi:hypothetical protein
MPIDYLVHLSNILLLVSYSLKDILWLRWFAVAVRSPTFRISSAEGNLR